MNKVLISTLSFRLILTPFLYIGKDNIIIMLILLIFLDIINCNPLNYFQKMN
jgi:hypothetical protein